MIDGLIDLDNYRGLVARRATRIRRRRLDASQAEAASLQRLQEEFEELLSEAPRANIWSEVVPKTRCLIRIFVAMPEAQDPLRLEFIPETLSDLTWLSARDIKSSKPDPA